VVNERTAPAVLALRDDEREGLLEVADTIQNVEWLKQRSRFRSCGLPLTECATTSSRGGQSRPANTVFELLRPMRRARTDWVHVPENLRVIAAMARVCTEQAEAGAAGTL
jgi:hypothetical protein